MKTKICTTCKTRKPISEYSPHKHGTHGVRSLCKKCTRRWYYDYSRTKDGIIAIIFRDQKKSSNQRRYAHPNYSLVELRIWAFSQDIFHELYDLWVVSGYKKSEKPSFDRIDDYMSYTLDNLQIVTWRENNTREHSDRVNGINTKQCDAVLQFTKDMVFVDEHYSMSQAYRDTGINNISACCSGQLKTAGGFIWVKKEKF